MKKGFSKGTCPCAGRDPVRTKNGSLLSQGYDRRGFSLVEISVVLTIVGIVLVTATTIIKPMVFNAQVETTQTRMRLIFIRLSEYVQRNNRLPCPADPSDLASFGRERNIGADGLGRCNDATSTLAEGIVPFAALGLTENDVRDAWDNLITYRVAAPWTINFNDRDGVAPNPNVSNLADLDEVGNACRGAAWISGGVNINPGKALFCCLPFLTGGDDSGVAFNQANVDIRILDDAGVSLFDPDGSAEPLTASSRASTGNIDSVYYADPLVRLNQSYAIVVGLLSHGLNEHGAFIKGGAAIRRVNRAGAAGNAELENANGTDATATTAERVTWNAVALNDQTGANYFDDILMYRTNLQIYAETGTASCAYPD